MFRPHTSNNGAVLPFEYLPAAAGDYEAGQLLNVENAHRCSQGNHPCLPLHGYTHCGRG